MANSLKGVLSVLLFPLISAAGVQQPSPSISNNAEMAAIFAADQAPRTQGGAAVDWSVVGPQDEARRHRARALLDAGALRTADDFYHAAMVFQHGTDPSDFMLAHTLAIVAASRGRSDAAWLAAATMDRYLQSVGHSQIYGTQYRTSGGQNTTQEPYDRALISDSLRRALGVPSQAEQEVRRREIEQRYRSAPAR